MAQPSPVASPGAVHELDSQRTITVRHAAPNGVPNPAILIWQFEQTTDMDLPSSSFVYGGQPFVYIGGRERALRSALHAWILFGASCPNDGQEHDLVITIDNSSTSAWGAIVVENWQQVVGLAGVGYVGNDVSSGQISTVVTTEADVEAIADAVHVYNKGEAYILSIGNNSTLPQLIRLQPTIWTRGSTKHAIATSWAPGPQPPGPGTMAWGGSTGGDMTHLAVRLLGPATLAPSAPTVGTATWRTDGSESVRVTFTLNGGTSSYVHRLPAGAPKPNSALTRISGDLGAAATQFDDSTAEAGTAYDYWIEAANSGGNSFSSAKASITTPTAPTLQILSPAGPGLWIDAPAGVSSGKVKLQASVTPGAGVITSRQWACSVDGVKGAADLVRVTLTGQDGAPVARTLTFTVTDANGYTRSASVPFTVGLENAGRRFDHARRARRVLGGTA